MLPKRAPPLMRPVMKMVSNQVLDAMINPRLKLPAYLSLQVSENSARSSHPDPLARRRGARGRTHELRVNAARGGHPPSPSASDVVDVRSPAFCVTPGLDLA
jgi:hypothetical protein